MSNIFQEVLNDAGSVQDQLLGPTYPYYKNIKSPSQIGMSSKGTIQQMSNNVNGLINYVELLVSGKSKASATNRRFFITCRWKVHERLFEFPDTFDRVPEDAEHPSRICD